MNALFSVQKARLRSLLAGTQAFEDSSRRRKKIEMLFAHLKRQLGFDRLQTKAAEKIVISGYPGELITVDDFFHRIRSERILGHEYGLGKIG